MGDSGALRQDTFRGDRVREHVRALTFKWAGQIHRHHSQLFDTSTLGNTTR